jgi:hypothetical protein
VNRKISYDLEKDDVIVEKCQEIWLATMWWVIKVDFLPCFHILDASNPAFDTKRTLWQSRKQIDFLTGAGEREMLKIRQAKKSEVRRDVVSRSASICIQTSLPVKQIRPMWRVGVSHCPHRPKLNKCWARGDGWSELWYAREMDEADDMDEADEVDEMDESVIT